MPRYRNDSCPPAIMTCSCRTGIMMCGEVTPLAVAMSVPFPARSAAHSRRASSGHELAISSMRQVLIIPIHGSTPSSWKIAVHKANARIQEKVPNSFKC